MEHTENESNIGEKEKKIAGLKPEILSLVNRA